MDVRQAVDTVCSAGLRVRNSLYLAGPIGPTAPMPAYEASPALIQNGHIIDPFATATATRPAAGASVRPGTVVSIAWSSDPGGLIVVKSPGCAFRSPQRPVAVR